MARPYSQDLRDRVVGSVASGRTCRATAVLFGVSVASVVKWSQRWRASGRTAAKPMGGRRPLRLQRERGWLLARIAEKPDLTLRALMAELAERGTPASYGAVWRFFKHAGITFKKKPYTPASRIAPTSPAAAPGGRCTRAGLTPGAWCSSTRLGPRPT
jgi:transposase